MARVAHRVIKENFDALVNGTPAARAARRHRAAEDQAGQPLGFAVYEISSGRKLVCIVKNTEHTPLGYVRCRVFRPHVGVWTISKSIPLARLQPCVFPRDAELIAKARASDKPPGMAGGVFVEPAQRFSWTQEAAAKMADEEVKTTLEQVDPPTPGAYEGPLRQRLRQNGALSPRTVTVTLDLNEVEMLLALLGQPDSDHQFVAALARLQGLLLGDRT